MKTTIMDVARHAGVSIKTVSRVLNKEPNVTDKTRDKVNAAVKELRYRPNLSARGLASSKSYLLALLYDNPSSDYIAGIQEGATKVCRERGYHLVIEPLAITERDMTSEMEILLERLPVDGVILTPPICEDERLLKLFTKNNTPYVQIAPSKPAPGALSMLVDDATAAKEMTEYLISIGHKDIALIKGHPKHAATKDRLKGFRAAMSEAGLDAEKYLCQGDFTFASGQSCANKLLKMKQRPSAIFACNDDMAAGCISAAGQLGLSVPDDISICGFDDTSLASVLWPPLTTIRQPIEDMGSRAAQILINGIKESDEKTPPTLLSHELIVRASTSAP